MSLIERLYWLDAQIRDRRFPAAQDVSDYFSVSLRTAYNDAKHLKERLNAPLFFDHSGGGWAYSDETYILPFLALSKPEAIALRRSLLIAQAYLGASDSAVLRLLFERLSSSLPDTTFQESVAGSVHFTEAAPLPENLLEACRAAVRNRQRLRIVYHGAHRDEVTDRIVHPYHLVHFQGEPHLIAWCEWRRDFRQFFLGRFKTWELLEPDAAFIRDPGFDVDAYLQKGLGLQHGEPPVRVRVRFSPYQARWIRERRYPASQQIEALPDGGLILTMEVAGIAEVKRWLLAFGSHAEVLEPAALREAMREELKISAKIYDVAED